MCLTEYDEEKYTAFVKAEGFAEGFTKGRMKVIISLMKDGIISEEDAAESVDMTLEDFRKTEALYCLN